MKKISTEYCATRLDDWGGGFAPVFLGLKPRYETEAECLNDCNRLMASIFIETIRELQIHLEEELEECPDAV